MVVFTPTFSTGTITMQQTAFFLLQVSLEIQGSPELSARQVCHPKSYAPHLAPVNLPHLQQAQNCALQPDLHHSRHQ